MATRKRSRFSLSLIQTISATFLTIIALVIALSASSFKGMGQIGEQFEDLSQKALPMAMANAKLTRNVLEIVKLLNHGMQVTEPKELPVIESQIEALAIQSEGLTEKTSGVAVSLSNELKTKVENLHNITQAILLKQKAVIQIQTDINSAVGGFRYGLSSIGPEMNRISSFLSADNPQSSDAANRFIASASSMESTFLMMLTHTDLEKAEKEYREMRNRIAGINLAYSDFQALHPEVSDYASLTAPYEMVKAGFTDKGILHLILAKLEQSEQQRAEFKQASQLADETMLLLDQVSLAASDLINERENVVNTTIKTVSLMVIIAAVVISIIIFATLVGLRSWTNRGLKSVLSRLSALTEHDFREKADEVGPEELKEVARKLNLVIDSTYDSISTVTRNCETLYQTAEISHTAAEQTNEGLSKQNEALVSMVTTITQLEASIREIAMVTNASAEDALVATTQTEKGVEVVELNRARLEALETSFTMNEQSILELDERVKQIREMVDMISGIADNTNLLALNAAIEAARAGEQGRGFAVVADEVRKLASDTSQQTTNIRAMMNELTTAAERSRQAVSDSREEMTHALESSHEVKLVFSDINNAVKLIQERVEQISVATEEQERATADVSQSIAQISEQGEQTKLRLESMVESSEQVAEIAGHQQAMLHKYDL
ncbi:methyl-accepting chemotaxis protein [Vibrio natriegens]|uniref:Chemotaxis protein n=1 Tax=Vibrio natriegens NBRC 15636 = ATCC 14048 = DSM 759 TaxID=1219067 RepID=A0AAN1CVU4_VIBNA|nr:methyl-accepting chemotaxis protein [Vibrio natriegens]ALR15550.1 chemotaxis protein [Vibrio natriegens NBRC 15636 = ATCC 14048 = DSM 759]ANQ12591.1 chemotaxis protein [Vibrio natriegens NBRC 15636 = ATCC 14048 = DSM 759]EPM42422.1 chemotaxis protein [Vibrio natriegens NBRC 15636 = ATCC 14048 = DSM 759]MDX6026985.1 methyl-accepting chemotaxis protein [Vibrio natriegens NBRC 15636 = ATCC 14048 = DSM 759]UUI13066.1 methyl-accepting chemotaxis protein [Vibrio natriegens]